MPYRSIASRQVSRGNGTCWIGRSGATARVTAMAISSTHAITSGSETKLISRSSWVNSG